MTEPTTPPQHFEALRDFANDLLSHSGLQGPTFLWDRSIHDDAQSDDAERENIPVAPPEEAKQTIDAPIRWYLRAMDSLSPTPQADGADGINRTDMPTFYYSTGALSGVEAVVGNALMSTRWCDAAGNLATALITTSSFLGSIADREGEGLAYLKRLIDETRIYFDSVAQHADPVTGGQALSSIVSAACQDDFRFNPVQMVQLISCSLPFAQWDDTRVFVYDAIDRAQATMASVERDIRSNDKDDPAGNLMMDSEGNLVDVSAGGIREQFDMSMLMLRHDVLRMCGEDEQADRMLSEHSDIEPMADAYAAQLIRRGQWRQLRDFAGRVLADDPYQQMALIPPQLAPDEWHTILDLAQYELAHGQ